MSEDPTWYQWSARTLEAQANLMRLVINPVTYAEVSIRFSSIEALESALPVGLLEREPIPFEAAFLAGKCFMDYRMRGGARTAPLPDFFIGAHAAVAGYELITRDAARYRTYFPKLKLIAPP